MVTDNLVKENPKFQISTVKKLLTDENRFIQNLFSILPIPTSALQGQNEDEETSHKKYNFKLNGSNEKTRASSLTELQERLRNVQSKKKLNYKEKLLKKGLKNRLKKKTKRDERNANKKLVKVSKIETASHLKTEPSENNNSKSSIKTKPVFNKEGKMVFSKFDFTGLGAQKPEKKTKDPKKILKNLEKQKEKFAELEAKGEKDKVKELKEKQAWRNALAKSEGEKVKDDPILLKKSIKKREEIKKGSAKKWKTRTEGVEKAKEMRQTKRNENIEKRKKEKKHKKIKQAVQRGKIIPGF